MQLGSKSRSAWRRALLVAPIVVANAIAAMVPLLHAASHEAEHAEKAEHAEQGAVEERHHDGHPAELHDDWRIQGRVAVDFALVAPTRLHPMPPPAEFALDLPPRVDAAVSRAPPASDLARAPPTV